MTPQQYFKNNHQAIYEMIENHFGKNACQELWQAISKFSAQDTDNMLSPIATEKEFQIRQLKEIFPHYPEAYTPWQYMNHLLMLAKGSAAKDKKINELKEVLNTFPGFNAYGHSPQKIAEWSMLLVKAMEEENSNPQNNIYAKENKQSGDST